MPAARRGDIGLRAIAHGQRRSRWRGAWARRQRRRSPACWRPMPCAVAAPDASDRLLALAAESRATPTTLRPRCSAASWSSPWSTAGREPSASSRRPSLRAVAVRPRAAAVDRGDARRAAGDRAASATRSHNVGARGAGGGWPRAGGAWTCCAPRREDRLHEPYRVDASTPSCRADRRPRARPAPSAPPVGAGSTIIAFSDPGPRPSRSRPLCLDGGPSSAWRDRAIDRPARPEPERRASSGADALRGGRADRHRSRAGSGCAARCDRSSVRIGGMSPARRPEVRRLVARRRRSHPPRRRAASPRERAAGSDLVVVVSAMGDTTDHLLELAARITDEPDPREMDLLLATGEHMSGTLVAMALHALGRAGHQPDRRPGRHPHRSHARPGAHRQRRPGPGARGAGGAAGSVIVAGFQGATDESLADGRGDHARPRRLGHHRRRPRRPPRSRPLRDLHRRRGHLHRRPARRARRPPAARHRLRGDARDGPPGRAGDADPRRRAGLGQRRRSSPSARRSPTTRAR